MRSRLIRIAFALATIAAAYAQEASFSLPALGYLYDADGHSLRPIQGIIGAATVGEPLPLPFAISFAVSAPRLDFALARDVERRALFLVRNLGAQPVTEELTDVPAGDSLIALAVSGRVAAIYTNAANTIQVITGLPAQRAVQRSVDTGGARVRAIAISDSGRFLVAAFETDSENSTLLRVHDAETGSWKELGPAARVAAIAFGPNGNDIAVAADAPGAVSIVRDLAGAAEWRSVAGEAEGVMSPAGIRFSGDAALWIAAASGVTLVQLSDNSRTDLRCACKPTSLTELESGSTFRLTELSKEPIWVLHESPEGPKLLFIPPPVALETSEGAAQ